MGVANVLTFSNCIYLITCKNLMLQIAKKTQTSSAGPMITKFIITKPLNSKAMSGQTSVSQLIGGNGSCPLYIQYIHCWNRSIIGDIASLLMNFPGVPALAV